MEDINLNFADYKTILSHKGSILGEVSSCKISDFMNCLDKSIKDSMPKAKGVLINFGIHKDQTLFSINDLISEIHDFLNEDAEIIFATEQISSNDKEIVTYQIIMTGIESPKVKE